MWLGVDEGVLSHQAYGLHPLTRKMNFPFEMVLCCILSDF